MFFRYVVRSLMARPMSNAMAVLSIGFVVSACVVAVAFFHGVRENLAISGGINNVVVLSNSVLQTSKSNLSKEATDQLKAMSEVEALNGEPLVSIESHLDFPLEGPGMGLVPARGITPIAFQVHDQVEIIDGRAPSPGTNEI